MTSSSEAAPPSPDPRREGDGLLPTRAPVEEAFRKAWKSYRPANAMTLRDSVQSLVAALKRDGVPPERVMAKLKHEIASVDARHKSPSLGEERRAHDHDHRLSAYEVVFDAFLDAYYRR